MVKVILRLAANPGVMKFVDDQRGCPSFAADLAGKISDIATDRLPGTYHVTNQGATSWFEFAREVVAASGGDPSRIEPISSAQLDPPRPAPRPANSVLDNAVLRLSGMGVLPDWQDALHRLLDSMGVGSSGAPGIR